MGGGLLLRGSGSDDPVSAPGNRSSGKYGGKNAQNGVSGKNSGTGGTGRPVPQSTPAGPNAGLFLIRETTVRPPGSIRRRSPERCPQPGSQRLHLPERRGRAPGPQHRGAIRPHPAHEAEQPAAESAGRNHGHVRGRAQKTGPAARGYRFRQDGGLLTGRFPNSKIRKIRPDHGAGNFPDAPDGSAFQIPFRGTAFLRGSAAQPPLGWGAL